MSKQTGRVLRMQQINAWSTSFKCCFRNERRPRKSIRERWKEYSMREEGEVYNINTYTWVRLSSPITHQNQIQK